MDNTKYLDFAESLKLIRNEVVEDENNNSLIDEIYTDLLPQNGVISKVNLPRTTILVGRKGTGKSTIFQKSIKDITKDDKIIPIYIDVKTLYDNSTPTMNNQVAEYISNEDFAKSLIYKNFISEIILNSKAKIKDKLNESKLKRLLGISDTEYKEIEIRLDNIEQNTNRVFKQIEVSFVQSIKSIVEKSSNEGEGIGVELSKTPKMTLSNQCETKVNLKQEFDNILGTYLDIKGCLIQDLLEVREILKLKHIYIYLDDYSEVEEEAQKLFMDWFISPLNNLADNFVKFKIATYPKRFYYGKLDPQKFDQIPLDFYDSFYTVKNISRMEELAIGYTRRLINNRAKIFLGEGNLSEYFDMKNEELFEVLFDVSMNIPRKMGFILSYCYESNLIHGNKITKAAIANASVRYYDEVISRYFESNLHIMRPFNDKVEIENQKDLIKKIVITQTSNKQKIAKSSAKIFQIEGQPVSHFVINNDWSGLLDNLELNGYVSTYNKVNDKNNIPSTLFSLDYGLCRKHNLNYGRPKDTAFRKYYNETIFNFNNLIQNHFSSTQILRCEHGHEFPFEALQEIEKYSHMNCPTCLGERVFSKVNIEISNQEIINKIKKCEQQKVQLKDSNEYEILDVLRRQMPRALCSKEIAEEIDCSWQFVNKRADRVIENALIEVDESLHKKRRYFRITTKALESIFKEDVR